VKRPYGHSFYHCPDCGSDFRAPTAINVKCTQCGCRRCRAGKVGGGESPRSRYAPGRQEREAANREAYRLRRMARRGVMV